MRRLAGVTRHGVGLFSVLLLTSCNVLFAPSYPELAGSDLPIGDGVTFYNQDESGSNTQLTVDLDDSGTDLYLVFSNPSDTAQSGTDVQVAGGGGPVTPNRSLSILDPVPTAPSSEAYQAAEDEYVPGNPAITDWVPPALVSEGSTARAIQESSVTDEEAATGTESEFFVGADGRRARATLVSRIDDRKGPSGRAVEMWVESGNLSCNGGKVTPDMVSAIGSRFLQPGSADDDILDWVTEMVGEPWGTTPYSNLIGDSRTITILIYNIEGNGAGGTVGYYWSKDSFDRRAVPSSNERVMFYLDSETLSEAEGTAWEITDYWPSVLISTLAHELQHTVHFYQRQVVRGANTETWLNETMSLMVEDLISEKLGIPGPRGVSPVIYSTGCAGEAQNYTGRLPRYNRVNNRSVTAWGGTGSVLDSYSLAYSFGAYLARNFGGVELLRAMMESGASSSERVLQEAISTRGYRNGTLEQLLWRWGVSTIRSDAPASEPFLLNSGHWSTAAESFVLGSINHYNYPSADTVGPRVFTGDISTVVLEPGAKLIYRVGENLIGAVELTVSAGPDIDFAVVRK
jgi:hypothetical protein